MVSRRSQTSIVQEQPVRFYKLIALTFLVLTIALLGIVVFMSAKRAEITISTKVAPIDITSDIVFSSDQTHGVAYEMATTTITEERQFKPSGTREELGIAEGMVTLHNESTLDQPLVATTRLQQGDIVFRLKERVVVPAKATVQNVAVYADKEGAEYHLPPTRFIIPGLQEAKQKEIYATSDAPMTGGIRNIGIISSEDMEQAIASMRAYIEKKAAETFSPESSSGKQALFHVQSLAVVPSHEVGEEIDAFTLQATAEVLIVSYASDALQQWAKQELTKRSLEHTDLIQPSDKAPTVTFVHYDASKQEATARVFYDGTVSLSAESKQIEKALFFGKDKNEVRRYLLGLDHVHSVDVKLHPAWIQTVPHIADHVTVIIQEVE